MLDMGQLRHVDRPQLTVRLMKPVCVKIIKNAIANRAKIASSIITPVTSVNILTWLGTS